MMMITLQAHKKIMMRIWNPLEMEFKQMSNEESGIRKPTTTNTNNVYDEVGKDSLSQDIKFLKEKESEADCRL
jgi:hypothetical protein